MDLWLGTRKDGWIYIYILHIFTHDIIDIVGGGWPHQNDFCFPGMTDPTKQRTYWDEHRMNHWDQLTSEKKQNCNTQHNLRQIFNMTINMTIYDHIWPILELFWTYQKMSRFAQHQKLTHPVLQAANSRLKSADAVYKAASPDLGSGELRGGGSTLW